MRLGIKAHWRDVDTMAKVAKRHEARMLEYQMLPGDLEAHREDAFEAFVPYRKDFQLRVHQPEAILLDDAWVLLDPASPDARVRDASAAALGECARLAMEMEADALIVHPGGLWRGNVGGGSEHLRAALEDVPRHVMLFLENMPCFYEPRSAPPEQRGVPPAQFRIPEGLLRVDDLVDGYCLDVSHAYLAVEKGSLEVPRAFVRDLGPRIRHVHANGARGGIGPQGEGTPFDDSDYGPDFVRDLVARLPGDVVVVPEIMDGHKDEGLGFARALATLRAAQP